MRCDSWWTSLICIFDVATLSSFNKDGQGDKQTVLQGASTARVVEEVQVETQPTVPTNAETGGYHELSGYDPPYDPFDPPDPAAKIKCEYPLMGKDWKPCNSPDDRGCWLRGPGGQEYNIKTNYEDNMPIGVKRQYFLNVTEKALAPDGVPMAYGKVFNDQYPGPWSGFCSFDCPYSCSNSGLHDKSWKYKLMALLALSLIEYSLITRLLRSPSVLGRRARNHRTQ